LYSEFHPDDDSKKNGTPGLVLVCFSKNKEIMFQFKTWFCKSDPLMVLDNWSETSGLLPTNSGSRPFFPPK